MSASARTSIGYSSLSDSSISSGIESRSWIAATNVPRERRRNGFGPSRGIALRARLRPPARDRFEDEVRVAGGLTGDCAATLEPLPQCREQLLRRAALRLADQRD